MAGHKHAALMLQYAQDAAETDRPWERWEFSNPSVPEWRSVEFSHPLWDEDCNYRRKPRTIRIGEFDVPEPLREAPAMESTYWAIDFFAKDSFVVDYQWDNDSTDQRMLRAGVCHATREAAELHAKALISLSAPK